MSEDDKQVGFESPHLSTVDYLPAKTEIARTLARAAASVHAAFDEIAATVQPAVEGAGRALESIRAQLAPALGAVAKIMAELPERTRSELGALATHGWYLDPGMDLHQLALYRKLLLEQGPEIADAALTQHFSARSGDIERELCEKFPHRSPILWAAFRAHRSRDYALSVPAFLIQADGICKEETGFQLFKRVGQETALAFLGRLQGVDPLMVALLSPLAGVHPLIFSENERRGLDGILNRHAILHGESVTYGSEANSCKAMSLLAFTSWIVPELKKSSAQLA